MPGGENLPPLFPPATALVSIHRPACGRYSTGTATLSLPPCRVDSPRWTSSGRVGSRRRGSAQLRITGDIAMATQLPSTEMRRQTIYDRKRCVAAVATRVQALVDRFQEQLKNYGVFQTSHAEDAYSSHKLQIEYIGDDVNESLSRLVDTASAQAVRRHFDDPFLSNLERTASQYGMTLQRTEERKRMTTISRDDLESQRGGLYNRDKFGLCVELWLRESDIVNKEAVRQERMFYQSERVKSERAERRKRLDTLNRELDSLQDAERWAPTPETEGKGSYEREESPMVQSELILQQKILWEKFVAGENKSVHQLRTERRFKEDQLSTRPASEVGLHSWVEQGRPGNTHRHEEAAVKIQCAYRCYCSRQKAAIKRYTRQLIFVECLQNEEMKCTWESTLSVHEQPSHQSSTVSLLIPATKVISEKLAALALKRRSRKLRELERQRQIERYAATTIQRVYRGYRGRVWAKLMRLGDPEVILMEARLATYALLVQARWRGRQVRVELERKQAAAMVIQRIVRSKAARQLLRRKRRAKLREIEHFTRQYHIQIIIRFIQKCVARRKEYMSTRMNELLLIQRIGRGRNGRSILEKKHNRICAARLFVASHLQRRYRGFRGRHTAQQAREHRHRQMEEMQRDDAARTIQRCWRFARAYVLEKSRRIKMENERLYRELRKRRRTKMAIRRMEIAALKIQHWYCNHRYVRMVRAMQREKHDRMIQEESAERIKRFYRMQKYRKSRQGLQEGAFSSPTK
uniref:Uncharacterized protein TCIL3000_5_2720 n=1 Tax=Trypanosoma congolense (strain IL3000) TaxID=1068625 RepID=G0UN01_TRYCI|nr:unnamed protein product [Trypanosoma congolense IL3000]